MGQVQEDQMLHQTTARKGFVRRQRMSIGSAVTSLAPKDQGGNLATKATVLQSEVRNTAHKHAIHPAMSTPQPSITEFACRYHFLAQRICDL